MKAVFDTGVVVAAIFWRSEPRRCLAAFARRRFQLFVTEAILEEYERIAWRVRAEEPLERDPQVTALVGVEEPTAARRAGSATDLLSLKCRMLRGEPRRFLHSIGLSLSGAQRATLSRVNQSLADGWD